MTKRYKAMQTALALWRFAREVDQATSKTWGQLLCSFWFPSGPRKFHNTDNLRATARKIAREAMCR